MNMEDRLSRAQAFLESGQSMLLTAPWHRRFLLKFPSSAGTIFLTAERRFFIVDFRYIEAAHGIGNGFEVILQEELAVQLRALAKENGVTAVLTDAKALSFEELEVLRRLFERDCLKASGRLTDFLGALAQAETEEENRCAERIRAIAERVEKRFARFVRVGASLESLKRKLGQIRGEEGDESRTFAAEFAVQSGKAEACVAEGVLPAGSTLCVRFALEAGLVSRGQAMRFPVKALPAVPVQSRRAALCALLWEENSAVLLCGRPSIRYYIGADPGPESQLLLMHSEILLFSRRRPAVSGITVLPGDFEGMPAKAAAYLEAAVRAAGVRKIYAEPDIPMKVLGVWRGLPCPVVPSRALEERIYSRRSVKREEELARIRAAQDVTDRVFLEALNYIHAGMTDIEIQRMVGMLFYEMGSQMDSFDHVCGCGPDTAKPHVKPTGRAARRGDFVMLDIGASVDGYGSDMTRMVGIGAVDAEKQEIYNLVLEAQNAGIQAARAGAVCCAVDGAARQRISDGGFGPYFLHGLGHPVGCGGKEGPRFSQSDTSVLRPGVVMTVEPGIYLPGRFGVRIEDMVYIGEQGTENLTHSPKTLPCVK
ncbi:MAG: M24 family metallopeptidase [Acutalibacteraceae bacterium]